MTTLMEYPLDEEELQRLLRLYGREARLVWMTPDEFLTKVPHPATEIIPAIVDLRAKWFSESSLGYLRKAFLEKVKLEPLILDYTKMFRGWPSHEGRHRAYVAKTYGIEKVPVLVIGHESYL